MVLIGLLIFLGVIRNNHLNATMFAFIGFTTPICDIWNELIGISKASYNPFTCTTLDEALLGFRGRCVQI